MQRIDYIDSIKGFAILLVVMGHTFHDFKNINLAFIDLIYAFHMPLFFIISGYLGYKKDYTLEKKYLYIKNKAVTLIIPFIFFGTIYSYIYNYEWFLLFTSSEKLGYWFTFSLFLIFTLYYGIESIYFYLKKYHSSDLVYIILLLIPYIILELVRISNCFSTNVFNLLGGSSLRVYYIFFIIGIIVRKYNFCNNLFSNKIIYFFSIILFGVCFCIRHTHYSNYVTLIILGLTGSIITIYFFYKYSNNIPLYKVFVKLGNKSLDIYMLHYFFLIRIPQDSILLQDSFIIISNNIIVQVFVSLILSCMTISISYIVSAIIRENSFLSLISLGIKNK